MPEPDDGWLYAVDLNLVYERLAAIDGPTIIQLSTYGGGNNPHDQTIQQVNAILQNGQGGGRGTFDMIAPVIEDDRMMALIYAGEVDWANRMDGLPATYTTWRNGN